MCVCIRQVSFLFFSRFSGPIDSCLKKVSESQLQSIKEVFVYITSAYIQLTPPNSKLLFAYFGMNHILSVCPSARNKRVFGIVLRRPRCKSVCHLLRSRDDFTPKVFMETVKEALISINKQTMQNLQIKVNTQMYTYCVHVMLSNCLIQILSMHMSL